MNTCDTCKHYRAGMHHDLGGYCDMTHDINDVDEGTMEFDPTRAYGSDYESYAASVVVGPKFGCIHWKQA